MADANYICHEIPAILSAPRNEIKNTVFSVLRFILYSYSK